MSIQDEVIIRSIKVLDIGYITVIYFALALMISISIDSMLGAFDKDKAKHTSTARLVVEAITHIWFIGVIVYIARNVVELIPFPLNGVHGFEHTRVKELGNAAVFTFVVIFFQKHLRDKLEYLRERIISN